MDNLSEQSNGEIADRLEAEVKAQEGQFAFVLGVPIVQQAIAALRQPPSDAAMREALEACREEMRLLMLKQPTTGERETYSDGFVSGLCHAIRQIDAALTQGKPHADR